MTGLINGKPSYEYILLLEQRIAECSKQIERVATQNAKKYLDEVNKAFRLFKGSEMILLEPDIDTFSNEHLCNILLAYYAGRFTLMIRDYTFISRLMPGSILLAGYIEELKHIGVIKAGVKTHSIEGHQVLIQKLKNSSNQFRKRVIIDFMISCAKEAKKILKTTGEEVIRCRTDPKRRGKIQDLDLQTEALKVFDYEELPQVKTEEEDEEEEEEESEAEDPDGDDLEERADFKVCIDLFTGANVKPKAAADDDTALTYVPTEAVDFEELQRMVREEYDTTRKELQPFFVAKLIQGITRKMEPSFFKELTKPYRKPKKQAQPTTQ